MDRIGEAIHGHYGQYVSQSYGGAGEEDVNVFLSDIEVGTSDSMNYILCLKAQKNTPYFWSILSTTESISGVAEGYQSVAYCKNSLKNLYEIEQLLRFPFVTAEECNQYLSKRGTFCAENRAQATAYLTQNAEFEHDPQRAKEHFAFCDYVKIPKKLLAQIAAYCIYMASVGARQYLTILVPKQEADYQKYCRSVIFQILSAVPSWLRKGFTFATNPASRKREKFGIIFQRTQETRLENAVRLSAGEDYPFLRKIYLGSELCKFISDLVEQPWMLDNCYRELEAPLYLKGKLTKDSYIDYALSKSYWHEEITLDKLKEWNQRIGVESSDSTWMKSEIKELIRRKLNPEAFENMLMAKKEMLKKPEDISKLLGTYAAIIQVVYEGDKCFSIEFVRTLKEQVLYKEAWQERWESWNRMQEYETIFLGKVDEQAKQEIETELSEIEEQYKKELLNGCVNTLRQEMSVDNVQAILKNIQTYFPKSKKELLSQVYEEIAELLKETEGVSRKELDALNKIHKDNQLDTSFKAVYISRVLKDDLNRLAEAPSVELIKKYIRFKAEFAPQKAEDGKREAFSQVKNYFAKQGYAGNLDAAVERVENMKVIFNYSSRELSPTAEELISIRDSYRKAIEAQVNGIIQNEPLTRKCVKVLFEIAEKYPSQNMLEPQKKIQQYIREKGSMLKLGLREIEEMKQCVEAYTTPDAEFKKWYVEQEKLKEKEKAEELARKWYSSYSDYINVRCQNYDLLEKYPKVLEKMRRNQLEVESISFGEFMKKKNQMLKEAGWPLYIDEFSWCHKNEKIQIRVNQGNIESVREQISEYCTLAELANVSKVCFLMNNESKDYSVKLVKTILYPYLASAPSEEDKEQAMKFFGQIIKNCDLSKEETKKLTKAFRKSKKGVAVAALCAAFFVLGGVVVVTASLLLRSGKNQSTLPTVETETTQEEISSIEETETESEVEMKSEIESVQETEETELSLSENPSSVEDPSTVVNPNAVVDPTVAVDPTAANNGEIVVPLPAGGES